MLEKIRLTEMMFRIDANMVALLAKEITAFWMSANQKLSSKYQFKYRSERLAYNLLVLENPRSFLK